MSDPISSTDDAIARLEGRDPYDALLGTRVPGWLKAGPRRRQALIQVRKRLPIELGPLLGVPPFVMAKAAGCFLTAAARGVITGNATQEECAGFAGAALRAKGSLGGGTWGYEFDVQTRWAYYPSGTPNLIATVFVSRGFAAAGSACGRDDWIETARQGAGSILASHLSRAEDGSASLRYVPGSSATIHNADALGAGLLAACGALGSDEVMTRTALDVSEGVIAAQREDGSWPYGRGPGLDWQDSYHTAYVLDGLLQVWVATGESRVRDSLMAGLDHWTRSFFGTGGEPFFGPGRPYPMDIHSAATAVDLAARLATWGAETAELARRVLSWADRELVDPRTGATFHRRLRLLTDKRHFVRWGDGHLAMGRASVRLIERSARDPLEEAVTSPGERPSLR